MPRARSWADKELIAAVRASYSYRAVLLKLGLVPAGGNYVQVQARVRALSILTAHFTGARWNGGKAYHTRSRPALETLLVQDSHVQSYKLKKRLYESGLKWPKCELCGWAKVSDDGRIPLELDHINGDH